MKPAQRAVDRLPRDPSVKEPASPGALGVTLMVAMIVCAERVQAQDPPPERVVRGRVIDAVTRQPLGNALVMHEPTSAGELTDSAGGFALRLRITGPVVISVGRFGYEDMRFELPDSVTDRALVLPINPEPVILEGLDIAVDRLERLERRIETRSRTHAGAARSVAGDQIAGVGTAFDLVRRRTGSTFRCNEDPNELCSRARNGRELQIRICIDEQPAWGGILMLEALDIGEVYRLELFDLRVSQIRIYTRSFMLRNLNREPAFRPLELGC